MSFSVSPAAVFDQMPNPSPVPQRSSPEKAPKNDTNSLTPALPLPRIKRIALLEPALSGKVSSTTTLALSLCTQHFLTYMLQHAHEYTRRDGRKKVSYKDVRLCIEEVEQLGFLEDIVPKMVSVKAAVEKRDGKQVVEDTLKEMGKSSEADGDVENVGTNDAPKNPTSSSISTTVSEIEEDEPNNVESGEPSTQPSESGVQQMETDE